MRKNFFYVINYLGVRKKMNFGFYVILFLFLVGFCVFLLVMGVPGFFLAVLGMIILVIAFELFLKNYGKYNKEKQQNEQFVEDSDLINKIEYVNGDDVIITLRSLFDNIINTYNKIKDNEKNIALY